MTNNKKQKVKVSILSPTLCKGGVDRAYVLAQALQKLNFDVEILGFLFGEKIYPEPPPTLEVKAIQASGLPSFVGYGVELLNKIEGDIIYAVKPKPASFGVGLLKKILTKRPIILDIDDWELSWCGGDEGRYRPSLKQLARDILKKDGALRDVSHPVYLRWMEKLVKQADAVTVDTSFLQKRFGGVYLPNGKDTCLFNPENFNAEESRIRYGLSGLRVLMFPGAPRPHKGLEDVLIALDRLNNPDYKLVIVGENPYDNYDKSLIARWGRWIVNLPSVPVVEMPAVVAAAHVVVVPQRDEWTAVGQFPIKLSEGMAMGKPVLGTRVGDIPEILGETGFLVDAGRPDQIAEALETIFQDIERANLRGVMARQRCIERYSVDAMAEILSRVLVSVLL